MDEKMMKEGSHDKGGVCADGSCGECGSCCEEGCGKHGAGCEGGCGCRCMCHKAFSMLVIAFGLTFFLGAVNVIEPETVSLVWPILVVLAGAKKLFAGMCKCC